MLHFPIELQIKLVRCCFCLSNFIRRHNNFEDDEFDLLTEEEMATEVEFALEDDRLAYARQVADADEVNEAAAANADEETPGQWRDRVAMMMWVDYQAELVRRGI